MGCIKSRLPIEFNDNWNERQRNEMAEPLDEEVSSSHRSQDHYFQFLHSIIRLYSAHLSSSSRYQFCRQSSSSDSFLLQSIETELSCRHLSRCRATTWTALISNLIPEPMCLSPISVKDGVADLRGNQRILSSLVHSWLLQLLEI